MHKLADFHICLLKTRSSRDHHGNNDAQQTVYHKNTDFYLLLSHLWSRGKQNTAIQKHHYYRVHNHPHLFSAFVLI